jgi:hypothetical protein
LFWAGCVNCGRTCGEKYILLKLSAPAQEKAEPIFTTWPLHNFIELNQSLSPVLRPGAEIESLRRQ